MTNDQQQQQPTYADKTNRIQAWTQLIKSLTPLIWLCVIVIVIIPLIGNLFITQAIAPENLTPKNESVVVIDRAIPNRDRIEREIIKAIQEARIQSQSLASVELDNWINDLITRVDKSFLPWYFDYFNQKKMEFSTPFIWLSSAVAHEIDANNPSPNRAVAEKLTKAFQTEFAKRVLRPKIAQLQLERITRKTAESYLNNLKNNLATIQSSYQIPQGQWERYLDDIAITIADTEGNISNLSMKVLVGGSTYLLAKATLPTATKIGSKVVASLAGKASAKIAAKTGGAVAGNLGVQFLDPIVGVGIIIWDLWDYYHTVQVEKPILREAIGDYLQEVKASLLEERENSIMEAIYQLEDGILKSL
jgi:hypothetical protein